MLSMNILCGCKFSICAGGTIPDWSCQSFHTYMREFLKLFKTSFPLFCYGSRRYGSILSFWGCCRCCAVYLVANVFWGLFQYFKKVKNAPKLSCELQDQAYLLSNILNEIQSTLEDTDSRPIAASTNILNDTVVEFAKTMKDMEGQFVVKEGELKKRLQWPFTEKDNKQFLEKLERYKSIFDSALNIIQRYVHFNYFR